VTHRVRFAPEAVTEIEDAARWYEQRRRGLGLALLASVDEAVASTVRWPHTGAPVPEVPPELEVRKAAVRRFPYYLAYVVTDEEIYILAVAHNRRRPGYWSGRIEGS
jgi:plasmid stabilization system protein ParE